MRIAGYRAWNVRGNALTATAITVNAKAKRWRPGVNGARCASTLSPTRDHGDHSVADAGRHCGFYACWTLDWARTQYDYTSAPVFGIIAGWGERVTLHEHGFRASEARIVALLHAPYDGMRKLAARYGVPYIAAEDAPLLVKELGLVGKEDIPESATVSRPAPQPDYVMVNVPGSFAPVRATVTNSTTLTLTQMEAKWPYNPLYPYLGEPQRRYQCGCGYAWIGPALTPGDRCLACRALLA